MPVAFWHLKHDILLSRFIVVLFFYLFNLNIATSLVTSQTQIPLDQVEFLLS